ncbi:PepSY-like domain-containing protein [Chryseolinea sp. T2]|uniref:PepSY-like domain-containing protein n=1 Tax=Chryseolinea sp. T2 TaxID=3129255 RepID=UPI0030779C4F
MKQFLVVLALLFSSQWLVAQKIAASEVPQNVKSTLVKSYNGKGVVWSKESAGYEASYKQNGKEISLVIDTSGKIVETETEIEKSELPASILEVLKTDYKDYKLEEAAKIVAADNAITYEAEVEKGEDTFDLIFDSAGKLLSKESKEDHN